MSSRSESAHSRRRRRRGALFPDRQKGRRRGGISEALVVLPLPGWLYAGTRIPGVDLLE